VILGKFRDADPPTLSSVRLAVTANGDPGAFAYPRETIGDIGKVVSALVDQAGLHDETFRPGDIIITGAAVPPAPLNPRDEYRVELNFGGPVTVEVG